MLWVVGVARGTPTPLAAISFCLAFVMAVVSASFDFVVRPEFGEQASELNVTTFVGQTGRLPCTVRHLAGKRVSWIRGRDLQVLSTGRVTFSTDLRISVLPGTTTPFKSRRSRSAECLGCGPLKSHRSSSIRYFDCDNTTSYSTDEGAARKTGDGRRDCGGGISGERTETSGKYLKSGGNVNCFGACSGSTVGGGGGEDTDINGNYIGNGGESFDCVDGRGGDGISDDLQGQTPHQQNSGGYNLGNTANENGDYSIQKPKILKQQKRYSRTKDHESFHEASEGILKRSVSEFAKYSREKLTMPSSGLMTKEIGKESVKRQGDGFRKIYQSYSYASHNKVQTGRPTLSDHQRDLEINPHQKRTRNIDYHHKHRSQGCQRKHDQKFYQQRNHDSQINSRRRIDCQIIWYKDLEYDKNRNHEGNSKRNLSNKRNRGCQRDSKRNPSYQRKHENQVNLQTNFDYHGNSDYLKSSKRSFDYSVTRERKTDHKTHKEMPMSSRRRSRREHRYYHHDAKPTNKLTQRAIVFGHRSLQSDQVAPSRHSQAYAEHNSPIAIYPQGRSAQATGAPNKGLQPGPNYIEGVWEPEDYTLQIKYTKPEDSGTYICQINTEPRITQIVHLNVVKMRAEIVGSRELFVKAGNPVTFACRINHGTLMPGFILWYKNELLVEYGDRVEVQTGEDGVSHLLLRQARPSDSANYTCSPSNGAPASLTLNVIVDERQAAMQQGNTAPPTSSPSLGVLESLLLAAAAVYHSGLTFTHITGRQLLTLAALLFPYQQLLSLTY